MGKNTKRLLSMVIVAFLMSANVQASDVLDKELKNKHIDQFVEEHQEINNNKKDKQLKMENKEKPKLQKSVDKEKYKRDNLLVKIKDNNQVKDLDIDEKIVGEYKDLDAISVEIPKGKDIEKVKEKLEKTPGVESVEQEYIATTSYVPQDPYYLSHQWNLKKINMENAWDITKGVSSTVIAVIDTGVGQQDDLTTPLVNGASILAGITQVDTYPGEFSYDGGANDSITIDSYGFSVYPHGTAVASIVSSSMNSQGIAGIIPNAKIMPIKVFKDGEGTCSFLDVALGIRWAVDNGADIINLSLGGPFAPNELEDAVNYAHSQGAVVVAATGNEGTDVINYPAIYENTVAVGSTNSTDNVSGFSNKGLELDVVAPGEQIYTPYIGQQSYQSFRNISGTSFASPTIAAVAGLIKSKYSSLNNEQITRIMYTSAKDLTTIEGWDGDSGFGRVDAVAALQLAANTSIWDKNDKISSATSLGISSQVSEKLYPAKDKDVYKLSVTKPGNIKVAVNSSKDFDLMLVLTDSNGQVIDYVDDGEAGERELLSTTISSTGNYYIWVSDYYGDFSNTAKYNLEMNPVSSGELDRYAGVDKWNTAALISKNAWVQSDSVILAYGNNFPDALAGAPIASQLNAPILLTSKDSIPISTMNEITRLKPKTIYLLGGHLVISNELESSLKSKGYNVKRLYGADKYKTAIDIGEELRKKTSTDTVVLAYGGNYPDALSIGGFAGENGWPLLFTGNKSLNVDTKKAISDWNIKKVIIVGGHLVVSPSTENELKSMGLSVERIAGATLWETSMKIVQKFKKTTDGVIITTGKNYPDALSGGALAYKYSYPVLLVERNNATSSVLNYITSSGADRGIILGGTLAVEEIVRNQVYNQLK